MKYDYCGERVPWYMPIALCEGWRDARRLPNDGNLYRRRFLPWFLWMTGNMAGSALGARSKKR